MKSAVVAGLLMSDSLAPFAFALSVGVYKSQRNTLMCAGSPGPGAATTQGRPDIESIRPAVRVAPAVDPGEGAKVENTSGPDPGGAARCEETPLSCESAPGPAPTMM